MAIKKPRKVNFRQAFISRTLGNGTNWPRENKIMGKLVELYPEEAFWGGVSIKFKIPSLAWFITDKGSEFLRLEYKKFKFTPEERKQYEFDQEKVEKTAESPIITTKSKVKSMKDFLGMWK